MNTQARLKQTLDQLYSDYKQEFLRSPQTFFERRKDPLLFPHRYKTFHDIEVAAFIATTFAYGNVTSLCNFIGSLLSRMGDSPASFLKNPEALTELQQYKPYYRLHKEREILQLLKMVSLVYSRHGSLYEVFQKTYYNNSTIQTASIGFVENLRKISGNQHTFLLPDPSSGGPCKRLNLFLRWMVRRDGLDLGLWKDISPAHLVMPLDTHIGRVGYKLGWISTPSLSWKKAEAITDVLRKFDQEDPTRYDFALCHESMEKSPFLSKLINHKGS
ncbi:TIGR02757 family protein [bacterium]|nr:TIGR02757 family protein [bacterium]